MFLWISFAVIPRWYRDDGDGDDDPVVVTAGDLEKSGVPGAAEEGRRCGRVEV